MKFFGIIITFLVAIIGCVIASEFRTETAKPPKPRTDNPFLIWQSIPKVVEKLKERFPNQNIEIFIPSILKEIQQSIQLQPFSPEALQQLISNLIEQMFSQMNSGKPKPPGPQAPSVPSEDDKPSLDREFETKTKTEPTTTLAEKAVEISTQLPDLAFDRDPNKRPLIAAIKNDTKPESEEELEEEEEEISEVPTVLSALREVDNHHSVGDLVLYPDDDETIRKQIQQNRLD